MGTSEYNSAYVGCFSAMGYSGLSIPKYPLPDGYDAFETYLKCESAAIENGKETLLNLKSLSIY